MLTRAPTRSRCRSVVQGSRPIANSTYTHKHNRHKYRQTNWAIFLMLAGEKVWGHYSSTVLVYPLLFLCFSVELSFGWKCGVAIIWSCILLQAVAETVLLPYRINMVYVYSLNFPHYLPVLWNNSFEDELKMILFHIAAIGWISQQTGYKIQGSYTKLNHIVKTKIGNLKAILDFRF